MEITVLAFGQVAELTGRSSWMVAEISDTDTLVAHLEKDYPSLKNIQYRLAVNQQIISANTSLSDRFTVALLPPFSGG